MIDHLMDDEGVDPKELEQEAEKFLGELEDLEDNSPQSFSPSSSRSSTTAPTSLAAPKDPKQWSLFSSVQEVMELASNRWNESRAKWFGVPMQDDIRVKGMDKDIVLLQGIPYYTHTNTNHIFPYTNIGAFEHPHKHKLNIYLPPKVSIKPPADMELILKNFDEVMALYTQDNTKLNLPVVVHVHGGGWLRGDRNLSFYGAPFMGLGYARKGFVSVTVSYRLASKTHQHPAQIEDVARAVRWVFDHCHQFGGDKNKIFISGHSAGAHLASLATVHPLYLSQLGLPSNIIKGAVLISGIYDLSKAVTNSEQWLWKECLFQRAYVVPTFGIDPQIWKDSSPYHQVSVRAADLPLPPIVLINAASDLGLEYGAQRFYSQLKEKGVKVESHIVPLTSHKTISQSSKSLELATDFIQKILVSL